MSTRDGSDAELARTLGFEELDDGPDSLDAELKVLLGSPALHALKVGDVVGQRYKITGVIGEGGMGRVFMARHLVTDGRVAIKTVRADWLDSPRAAKRFELEARHTASLSHPNIVKVFDYGREEDVLYLVMEFIEGSTLRATIRRERRLGWRRTLRVLEQVLMGLAAAHENDRQLIHRDIKPDNILLCDYAGQTDFVKVVDFGISRATHGTSPGTGSIIGTPHTMAPEQWKGEPVSPATDLYAVGCTAYIALSGHLPFQGKGAQVGVAHLTEQPKALMPLVEEGTPEALGEWVSWLMQKRPRDRPQTALQARDALNAIALGNPQNGIPTCVVETGADSGETKASVRVKLPRFATSFVGRARELAMLDQLASKGAALVTLLGAGGLGKTRLSVEWARAQALAYPGGVYLCDLAEARALDGICLNLSQTLSVPLGNDDPVQTLGAALAEQGRVLVILDNFEQIVEQASASVGEWLEMAPNVTFVATSRHRLGLTGEFVVDVHPLNTAEPGALNVNEAITLFVDRARQAKPDFERTPNNTDAIAELVRQLDGLPLAIEMAAARVKALSPARILSRLSERFRLLRSSHRDTASRQATLKATLDWSWELLKPHEKTALAQCAVFMGSFSLEAAETILDLSTHEDAPWTMDIIESLVDKSLLRVMGDRDRYKMFVSIHQYAQTRLRDPSRAAQVQGVWERHLTYFAQYGQRAFIDRLDRSRKPLDELELELDNLNAALTYALSVNGHPDPAGLCALAIGEYFIRQGPYQVGLDRAEEALDVDAQTHTKARLARLAGYLNREIGRLEEAQHHYQTSLTLARESGDRDLEGYALLGLGYMFVDQGRLEEAQHRYQDCLTLARTIGDKNLEGYALLGSGAVSSDLGRLEEAQHHYQTSLTLARGVGDRSLEGYSLSGWGYALMEQGNLEDADHHFLSSLAVARDVGDRSLEGNVTSGLGAVRADQGRWEEARQRFQTTLDLAHEAGDKSLEGYALLGLGSVHIGQGSPEKAQGHLQTGLGLAHELGEKGLNNALLLGLSLAHTLLGLYDQALDNLARVDRDASALVALEHDCLHALIFARQGDIDQANTALKRAKHQSNAFCLKPDAKLAQLIRRVERELG